MIITDIKDRFLTAEVYNIYSACMYKPTYEKFVVEARGLISDESVSVQGYLENDSLLGIIAVKRDEAGAEILGIATAQESRRNGIGRKLIEFASERFRALRAETDDDAVGFYRNCGFKIEKFVRTFPDGQRVRYNCTKK